MLTSRVVLVLAAYSSTVLSVCTKCPEQELHSVVKVADRIAKKLQKKKNEKVVVIDFPSADGKISALGELLSNQLSVALTQRMMAGNVVERTQLKARLR